MNRNPQQKPKPEQGQKGRLLTGNIGGGRPKGSRSKLGEAFIADLYADWLENGAEAIEQVREQRPQDYLKIVASILPRDLNVRVNDLEEVSEDELIARIRALSNDPTIRHILDDDESGGTVN